MPKNGAQPEFAESTQFPEAVRLLWEGTQKALEEWGLDRSDLASLCEVIIRLAEHRLALIQECGSPPAAEQVAEQLRHYRGLASELHRRAAATPPEPDWEEVAEKVRSAGAVRLDTLGRSKE